MNSIKYWGILVLIILFALGHMGEKTTGNNDNGKNIFQTDENIHEYLKSKIAHTYNNGTIFLDESGEVLYYIHRDGIEFFKNGIHCGYMTVVKFDNDFQAAWKDKPELCSIGRLGNMKSECRLLEDLSEDENMAYLYDCRTAIYTMEEVEKLSRTGILTEEEASNQTEQKFVLLYGKINSDIGYYMELSQFLLSTEDIRQIFKTISFSEDAFSESALKQFEQENCLKLNELNNSINYERNAIAYNISCGELRFTIPEGTRGIQISEQKWILYENGVNCEENLGFVMTEEFAVPYDNVETIISLYDADTNDGGSLKQTEEYYLYENIYDAEFDIYTQKCKREIMISKDLDKVILADWIYVR